MTFFKQYRFFYSNICEAVRTTNYIWVSNWPRFVCRYFGAILQRGFLAMNPIFILAKTFWRFLPQPIDSEPLVWKRNHQIFQVIKALVLLPAWSWFEDWWLVVSPITIRQSVSFKNLSEHSVFTAPLSFSWRFLWTRSCTMCAESTTTYAAHMVQHSHHPDGANATTQKLQNTKAGFSGAES